MVLGVSQEQFSEVLDAMFELQVKPQQHIIDQGDDGDNFYIIEKLVSHLFVFFHQSDRFSWTSSISTHLSVCALPRPGECTISLCRKMVPTCAWESTTTRGALAS